MLEHGRDILLLDGECGLCHRLAIFMDQRLNKNHTVITYKTIKSKDGMDLIKTFPQFQQNLDTVYLYRKGRSYIRSAAAIRCLLYLKWYWKIWFYILWVIPYPIRDTIYKIIARYRHKIFEKPELCKF
tara:strand:- start:246 stop:629 length:384 start_codon:yes stop_codon:yes gene_type:complete